MKFKADSKEELENTAFDRVEEFKKEVMHDRGCWCPSCFYWKLENPEIMDGNEKEEIHTS